MLEHRVRLLAGCVVGWATFRIARMAWCSSGPRACRKKSQWRFARCVTLGQLLAISTILCWSVDSGAWTAEIPSSTIWRVTRSGNGRGTGLACARGPRKTRCTQCSFGRAGRSSTTSNVMEPRLQQGGCSTLVLQTCTRPPNARNVFLCSVCSVFRMCSASVVENCAQAPAGQTFRSASGRFMPSDRAGGA